MDQQGFEEYTFFVYGRKNGTANSYIRAIRILDRIFANDDVFGLKGIVSVSAGRINIDNNLIENAIRPLALGRLCCAPHKDARIICSAAMTHRPTVQP